MKTISDASPPYGTVVFDCDSTLSRIEGIEELASACRAEVEALTARAMDGELPLEQAYGARLDLIRPTREDVSRVASLYTREALPNAAALVHALQSLGKRVLVVSGGLLPAVLPFARDLGIEDATRVSAVDIFFDLGGQYTGFDEASPLARSGGKISILKSIVGSTGAGAVAFVGDGATDLEAAPEVARFIAFAGVARRAQVVEQARVVCEAADLAALVPLLFSPEECATLRASGTHAPLLQAAASLQ